jgi:iron complex outermembrane receptor protein
MISTVIIDQNPRVPAYWGVNLHSSYQVTKNIEVFGLVRKLFDQRYYVFGTFFQTAGAPLAVYAGLRAKL